jgi:hypothetical protein
MEARIYRTSIYSPAPLSASDTFGFSRNIPDANIHKNELRPQWG